MVDRVINLEGRGLRGESFADVARRLGEMGSFDVPPNATDQQIIDLAAQNIGTLLSSFDLYPNTAAGIAATTNGKYFSVPGTGAVYAVLYQNVSGVATARGSLPSSAAIAGLGTIAPVTVNVLSSQSAALQSALNDPNVFEVILPVGTTWIASGIIVPPGKRLRGSSANDCVLKAMVDFEDSTVNPNMVTLQGEGPSIMRMTIDANKRGLGEAGTKRCNGVVAANGCTNYLRENLIVKNCTGYAVYDAGAEARTTPPSGRNVNIHTFNSQVHFEPQGANGVTYEDCHARDGDGDIPCLQWFHPLVGARNIRHYACTGYGAAGAGVDIAANIADCDSIYFDGCDFEVTGATVAFAVEAGYNNTTNLHLTNTRTVSQAGVGMVLYKAFGSMTQTRISGIGVGLESNDSAMICTGCEAYSYSNPAGSSASKAVYAPGTSKIRWNGGKLEAVGPVGLMIPYEGGVVVDSGTLTIPAGSGPSINVPANIQTAKGVRVEGGAFDGSDFKGAQFEYTGGVGWIAVLDSVTVPGTTTYQPIRAYGSIVEFWTTASPSSVAPTLSATFSPTGLNLVAGRTYQINGVTVAGPRKTGWATATGTATRTTFATGSVTLPQLAERVKALIDDLYNAQIGA